MTIRMTSICVVSNDSSGLSSSDEFGWNVAEINDEKQSMLLKDIRMALSGESTPSSESEDDSVLGTQNMQSRLSGNDSSRNTGQFRTDMTEGNRKILKPKLISNTVSDSDSDDFRERTLQNKRSGRFNVVASGDSAVTSGNKILKSSVVCSSSCTPLQVEEVVGVDVNHFTIDNSEPALFCEDLTEDDEVWLVQCPNNVNPHTLKEKFLLSRGTSKITVGHAQMLEVSSYSQCPETQAILLPSRIDHTCSLVVLKPAGQIVIREHIDTPHPTVNEVMKKKVTFPVGLKMRHPLLGADYEKELRSYTESLERFDRNHKQKKKKKKHKTDVEEFSVNDVIVDSKEIVHKKNKKRKLFSENTCEDTLLLSGVQVANKDICSSHSSNSKKRKKHANSLESILSVENTEECNVNSNEYFSKPKKKKKHKSSSEIEESPSMLEKSRTDRKRKRDETETSLEMSSEFSEKKCEKDFKKKMKREKKKRRLDIVVVKSQVDPKSNLLISEENILSAPVLEVSRSSVSENDRDTTDATEHRENSATESLADLRHTKKKKKRKKERNSAEDGASTHHSMI